MSGSKTPASWLLVSEKSPELSPPASPPVAVCGAVPVCSPDVPGLPATAVGRDMLGSNGGGWPELS